MRCHSAGEIGCFDVSAGLSFPHLYRSPDFDGRPRFAAMMQFPCPWSYVPIPRSGSTLCTNRIGETLHELSPRQRT